MHHALPIGDFATVATLVAISFFAFVIGEILRRWPERIEELTAGIDGYQWLLSPAANRAMIVQSGTILIGLSFATLLLALCLP